MDPSFRFYILNLGWSIVYINGSEVIISKYVYISLTIVFAIAIVKILIKCQTCGILSGSSLPKYTFMDV